MARRPKSWWRLKQIRHRDAVICSVLASSCLLAGEFNPGAGLYQQYIAPFAGAPALFLLYVVLTILAFTTVFGGILVLMGGINFLWGQVSRGRFLLGLGVGLSFIGLAKQFAYYWLTAGTPTVYLTYLTTTLTGFGLLLGFVSYTLMAEYALMLKKHARSAWRRWRRGRRPAPRPAPRNARSNGKPSGRSSNRRTMRS